MRWFTTWLTVLTVLLLPLGAAARKPGVRIYDATLTTALGAQVVDVEYLGARSGYLRITTSNLSGTTPTLDVVVSGVVGGVNVALCTVASITTATDTVVLLLGEPANGLTASGAIDAICQFPLVDDLSVSLTVTGATGSMDVDAFLATIPD